jgi:hypothetical protein
MPQNSWNAYTKQCEHEYLHLMWVALYEIWYYQNFKFYVCRGSIMNDTNVFLSYKLQAQKLKEKWSTKGTRPDGIEKIAMSFTLQISPIWSTKTFLNPLVWRVGRPKIETQCFCRVQGLTK